VPGLLRYVFSLRQLAPNGELVTDNTPSNCYLAGLVHLALPNAKIIHSSDPIETCVSCFFKLVSVEQNHTHDLGEIGRYYKRYERSAERLAPERILVVADLEGQA
jgi:Sulfotransferase family